MPHSPPTSVEDLLDRPWRMGRPYRPRAGRKRQIRMLTALVVLLGIIAAYWYLTDPSRIRAMAQAYLSRIVGGRVEIRGAHLSIFEGLRLDGVTVRVDEEPRSDSVVFTAQALLVKYKPGALLNGRIEATQIIALDPHVRLCEDLSRSERNWNYQRLRTPREDSPRTGAAADESPPVLPEVLLRSGQVDYARLVDGRYEPLGTLAIEGQFAPADQPHQYRFEVEGRGLGETVGPSIRGVFNMASQQVEARLRSFDFRGAIKSMLPAQVQQWLEAHNLSGRIEVPLFQYRPGKDGSRAAFRIETDLERVNLIFHRREMLGLDERRMQDAVGAFTSRMSHAGFNPMGAMDVLREAHDGQPLHLSWVTGKLIFTRDTAGETIEIRDMGGWIEQNSFVVNGRIDGFGGAAPARITVVSKDAFLPPRPHYLSAMPTEVQRVYYRLRPSGATRVVMNLTRPTTDAAVRVTGEVTLVDAKFLYNLFPYPIERVTGRMIFGFDERTGRDWLDIRDLRGYGPAGSINEKSIFTINGRLSPLNDANEVLLTVKAQNVTLDDGVFAALAPGVRKAMVSFAPAGKSHPHLFGDVLCVAHRPYGLEQSFSLDADLFMKDGAGTYSGFVYPLERVAGTIRIRADRVEVEDVTAQHGPARLSLSGRVDMPEDQPARPNLDLRIRGMPLDQDLLAALDPPDRQMIQALGLSGTLDVEGKLLGSPPPPLPLAGEGRGEGTGAPRAFAHDLRITLSGGSILPLDNDPAISDLSASLHLRQNRLTISSLTGRRGQATISGRGSIDWSTPAPTVSLSAEAQDVSLDAALRKFLPADVQPTYDALQPNGAIDAELTLSGAIPTTAPATARADGSASPAFRAVLRPRKLSITHKDIPYRIDDLSGQIVISPEQVELKELAGRHGEATIHLSGRRDAAANSWTLAARAQKLVVNDELRAALPSSVASAVKSINLSGQINVDVPKLLIRPTTGPATAPVASTRPAGSDADFAATVTLSDVAFDAAVPFTAVNGTIELSGRTRAGAPADLTGNLHLRSLQIAGRPTRDFRAVILKPADREALQLSKLSAHLCGGELTGQIELEAPESAGGRYAMLLMLNNADIRQVTEDAPKAGEGRVSASLGIEGKWNDPASRRGGGDVAVSGRELYQIPLILGLMNVTNLALPITSPYNQGSARYDVEGNRVQFRKIELQSGTMLMQGTGWLDYGTRKVKLTFVTASAGGWKIPLLDPLLQGARQELLQITVSGTIQEPKVAPRAMSTFTTTIDEVFKGPQPKPPKNK